MPVGESCKRELEITVPWEEVEKESQRVVDALRRKTRVPGFRPGKAPPSVIKSRYQGEIRQEVMEKLIPRYFWDEAREKDLKAVGAPDITNVDFQDGQSLKFRAEFEVFPEFELGEYKALEVSYSEPDVKEEEVDQELERLREQQATYRNLDPRPLDDGDMAVLSLKSAEVEGAPAINQDETTLTLGDAGTLPEFTENLRGKQPGDEVDFEVRYPDDFGNEKLAGKSIPFHAVIKALRRKELPELDDDFAADLGDFRTIAELRNHVRGVIENHHRKTASEAARQQVVDELVKRHDFVVPEQLVERQVRTRVERNLRSLARQGVDASKLNLDWRKVREAEHESAVRDVKAGLLLERIAAVENLQADEEEIDQQVQRYAKENSMTAATARAKLAEDGTLDGLRSHLRNEKTLQFLLDEAHKVEATPEPESKSSVAE